MYADFRIKVQRFFRKNSKIIYIVICVWAIIFIVNMALKRYEPPAELKTTYKPHTSVIDSTKTVPERISNPIEEMIEEYMGYCKEGNYQSAYNMLSDSCKEYLFNNDIENFADYVTSKINGNLNYAIQNYSNDGNTYMYQIKYTGDMLATGLTNSSYHYTEEKMIFKKQRDGSIEMAVGNFVDFYDIKSISENEYVKIDVKSVIKQYSVERYIVKFTNRTDNTIVIADKQAETEAVLQLKSGDFRERLDKQEDIILRPNETFTLELQYQKFYDNDDDAKSLSFGSIRVMEKYSGTEDVDEATIQSEIQNAVAKFSVSIPVEKKN